ncbi:MAG: prolipoprotein diacylglyceryl transferase [Candidatus Saganbacteria bacterium]|nr:prolipoprotein diacylglyceryl transferase [Candidatus Saganbacteria bacterium]
MHPILLKIGLINVYSYGTMLAIGFLAGTLVALRLAKKEGISEDKILEAMVYIILSSIIGARLAYALFFFWQFKENPLLIFSLGSGGLAFYGGLFFGILVVLWFARANRIPLLKLLDIGSAPVFLGYSITRIGCFLNGCCFGIVTNLPWGVKFPNLEGLRHPTQLYASAINLLFFFIALALFKRKKFDGEVFFVSLLLYMTYRFLIDFIREGPKLLFGLTSVQFISIFVFAAALYTLTLKFRKS